MKEAKAEVDYSRGHMDSHCGPLVQGDDGRCKFFIGRGGREEGRCEKVEGAIRPDYWCELWERLSS